VYLNPGINWKNIRVLAVDDEKVTLDYFREISGRLGFSCDLAPGGKEAISMITSKGSYDLYFVDWKMPGMGGVELVRRIREEAEKGGSRTGKPVVVMISAADLNSIEDEARAAGVDKFLFKPLFPSSIADLINESLGPGSLAGRENVKVETADSFPGRRLLLVEDVEINREIVQALLEPAGLIVDSAENGAEAVKIFSEAPGQYDLILMDIQMPEMDGYEATRQIRALEAACRLEFPSEYPKGIPIIAMTANVFREDIEKCLAVGMNDHVGKPFNPEEVLQKLRKYLPVD
jgi:CheY-like chemotaxis protein